ncbi:T-lymphocyte activation antigen CD80-like [Rhinatrema bivittatum]|uniref:T-lymphocyte activation antigen CD80-like n=1 Tax=Rhinatrema bivittatum TaxID=194408 RepID=UPI00112B360E|nr:T-lymphocyte activation antigen CD80-like [Rhinatrema bivittatum]
MTGAGSGHGMETQLLPAGGRRQLKRVPRALLAPGWISVAVMVVGFCFVPGLGSTVPIQVVINSTAELPCNHNIGPKESLVNYRVYWQKPLYRSMGDMVMFSLNDGKKETEHQDKAYVNRTALHANCSLFLSAIRVSDEGIYSCHVQRREENGVYISLPPLYVKLTVTAPFSQPIISKAAAAKASTANLTCLSHGGYPKPDLIWYNVTGEVAFPHSFVTTTFVQDPETQTYNLSSLLVMELTTAFDVACSVQSPYHPEENSTVLRLGIVTPSPPRDLKDILSITVGVATSVVIIFATFMLVRNCSPCAKEKNRKNKYSPPEEQRTNLNCEEPDLETRL